jgi:hypothetical protein
MKTLRLFFIVVVLGFVGASLAACSNDVPRQLTDAEKLWNDQGLANYDFTLERQCFCPEDYRGPVDVQVRNGSAVSITYVSTGAAVTDDRFAEADTIDKLFGILKDAYSGKNSFDQKADSVSVTYDADRGFPSAFFIDISQQIADEENGYTVTNFVPR